MNFIAFQETRQGARHSNQDRIGYLYTQDCAMLITCDGMGGHLHGEVAAEFVLHFLATEFRAQAQPRLAHPGRFLYATLLAANEALIAYAKAQGMKDVPRTTCVAAIIQDGAAHWAHVGDSRLYVIRQERVLVRTIDHSHVQNLLDAGDITPEQALTHPERNKIFNCIGQNTPPRVDIGDTLRLQAGDILLLASDGFWGPLPEEYITHGLSKTSKGMAIALPMLMDMAEALAGRECDNLSVVALYWQDGAPSKNDSVSAKTSPVTQDDFKFALRVIQVAMLGKAALR